MTVEISCLRTISQRVSHDSPQETVSCLRLQLSTDSSTGYLTSANAETQSTGGSFGGSFASDCSKRNVSGFKIMTVSRGYTEEADKLLDYLVYAIIPVYQGT